MYIQSLCIAGLCGALLLPSFCSANEGSHAATQHAAAANSKVVSASAAFDQAGRLWLATVKDGHVLVSSSDDLGKTYTTAVKVNAEAEAVAAEGESRPKIAIGPNGTLYVSYTQSLDKPYTGHIRFSRSLDGGKTFSRPVTVNDNLDIITHRFDSMAVNSRDEIHLVWIDKRDLQAAQQNKQAYTGAAIYHAVSRDGGQSFGANRKIADHSCECCRIALAIDNDGVPVATWRHVFGKNVRDHAIARLDANAAPLRISHDDWEVDACPHHGPALSVGADGSYHAVWFTNGKNRQGLFYARSTDRGAHFSAPLKFGNDDAQAAHPYVLSTGKSVYLVWKEFDGKNSSIRLMHSADNGTTWSAPKRIAESAGASDHPLLIARGEQVYLSWNTLREGFRLIDVTGEQP